MRVPLLVIAATAAAAAPGCFCGNACLDVFSNVAVEGLILGVEKIQGDSGRCTPTECVR